MVRRSFGIGSVFFALAVFAGAASANAQADVMKACGAEWQKLKADNQVKPGQTWKTYLAECRKAKAADAADEATPPEPTKASAAPATAAKPAATATPAAGEKALTPGQSAARERIKKCGAEWTAAKEAGKIKAGQKWPQYWSDCNKRLKAAGQ